MDHTPFIVGAYAAGALVLTWCALAPVLRLRRLRRQLADQQRRRAAAESA